MAAPCASKIFKAHTNVYFPTNIRAISSNRMSSIGYVARICEMRNEHEVSEGRDFLGDEA